MLYARFETHSHAWWRECVWHGGVLCLPCEACEGCAGLVDACLLGDVVKKVCVWMCGCVELGAGCGVR